MGQSRQEIDNLQERLAKQQAQRAEETAHLQARLEPMSKSMSDEINGLIRNHALQKQPN